MIENLKKHAGMLVNTGVKVAVVFRKIPNDDNNCLIVETERLPDSYHDYMMQCLNSREALETTDFYEVLNRRQFPDGMNCLTALHSRGFLRKEPTSNVNLIPLPGKSVPLDLINATIDNKMAEYTASKESVKPEPAIDANLEADPTAIANGLLLQADMLEKDAAAKREEAYTLCPDLRPGKGRPALPADIKAQKLEERKNKRRERDRAKAAEMKAAKQEAVLDAKVSAKLKRDSERLSISKKT